MKLITDHLWTWTEDKKLKRLCHQALSYKVDGYWFSKKFKEGFWDGSVSFVKYDRKKKLYYFPTGLLSRACAALDKKNIIYHIEDLRDFDVPDPDEDIYTLYPDIYLNKGIYSYQSEVVDDALIHTRGIIKVATGGGKTEIAASIIKALNKKTVWLTHKVNLLEQTHARLETRLQRPIGRYGGGHRDIQDITIATVQTLYNVNEDGQHKEMWEYLQTCDVVFGDELHHLESDQWFTTFGMIPSAFRYGLSATPNLEGAGMKLLGMTGEIITDISPTQLMDAGVLAKPRIWFVTVAEPQIPVKELIGGKKKKLSYAEVYKRGIIDNETRNSLIQSVASTYALEGRPFLICIKQIRHGELLENILTRSGLNVQFVRGATESEERIRAIEALGQGSLQGIIATNIFNEGQDIPTLEVVINASGTRGGGDAEKGDTGRVTIQILGRGTRKAGKKDSFDYVDFADQTHKFLTQASLDRLGTLRAEGYDAYIDYWHSYKSIN